MKGITTIAALPSGAGQAAHLPAEVGEAKAKPPVWMGVDMANGPDTSFIGIVARELALAFAKKVDREIMAQFKPFSTVTVIGSEAPAVPCCTSWGGVANFGKSPEFPAIDADMLDTSE